MEGPLCRSIHYVDFLKLDFEDFILLFFLDFFKFYDF